MQNLRMSHLDCIKRIIKRVKSTADFAIWYDTLAPTGLSGYTDADSAGSRGDRRSNSINMLFIGS